jgi:spore germination cell wall hydrolase CwlJ-like protein
MKNFIRLLTGKNPKDASTPSSEDYYNELAIDVLARTLWGEARGEDGQGMEAVANVVLNRVKVADDRGGYWWGNDLISVCQKPYQFSCWNRSDPNYRKLLEITETNIHFATAMRIARRAVAGVLSDNTNGATHYHEKSILPSWAKGQVPCAYIGRHIFYQLIEV